MFKSNFLSRALVHVIFLLPILLSSCDYAVVAAGTVYDKRTKLPVAGATVWEKYAIADSVTTDSNGYFKIVSQRGGFYSQRMKIVVQKDNYKQRRTTITAKHYEEIKLTPEGRTGND